MKSKLMVKCIITILLTVSIMFSYSEITFASTSIGDVVEGAHGFEDAGESLDSNTVSGSMTVDDSGIQEVSGVMYNAFLIVGIVVAVIVGLIIGIKFMTGNAQEQAKVKETIIPYIAGCIIIFGAYTIWRIVVTVLNTTQS